MIDSNNPASKRTIMVVDDNPDIVTIVKTLLEGNGFKVQPASSGQEVFILLTKKKPDLILLDIMMPWMDGLEVLTRLKSYSNTSTIPVVLLTAKQPDEAINGGYDLWADSYITKPFTNPQLLNVINRLIGPMQFAPFRLPHRTKFSRWGWEHLPAERWIYSTAQETERKPSQ